CILAGDHGASGWNDRSHVRRPPAVLLPFGQERGRCYRPGRQRLRRSVVRGVTVRNSDPLIAGPIGKPPARPLPTQAGWLPVAVRNRSTSFASASNADTSDLDRWRKGFRSTLPARSDHAAAARPRTMANGRNVPP